jgi:hypothetical protein
VQVLLGSATSSTLAAIQRAGFDRGPAGSRMRPSVAAAIEGASERSGGLG